MPSSIPMAIRQSILERYQGGESITSLSRHFGVSRGSIYSFIKRKTSEGEVGLRPKYGNCGKRRPAKDVFIYRAVRCLRTWHPSWGSEKIRAEMLHMRPDLLLPHYRTFTRWFHWNNQIGLRIKSNLPQTTTRQAKHVHEGWQIDAKEEMRIADGSKNCWLNITDEYSGMVIDPPVFPLEENLRSTHPKRSARIDFYLQNQGIPYWIKVDNGRPLGDPRLELIPPLALWLIGLG